MNTYNKFLLILCFCLTGMYTFAQESLSIDYHSIREEITNDSLLYAGIKNRYQRNDTTLTFSDYAILYYGYAFTPEYEGNDGTDKNNFERLINNQKYSEAYEMGKNILRRNPVALYVLYNMYYLAQALERPVQEANIFITRYSNFLYTISLSGDGQSEATAFKVITTDDEYQLIYNYWGVEKILTHNKINDYDIVEFDKSQHYKGRKMYFDISLPAKKERETEEKDLW